MGRRAFAWLLLLVAMPAGAQTLPPFTGFVVDAANVLPPDVEADLSAKLDALQRDTHRQLVVATVPDLQGYPLSDYGYKLGRTWGVGLRDVNNGIVLFIAPNEPAGHRGPRIEVGRGLEPIVPDALAYQIISEQMMPRLRATGDVPGAMTAGADALIGALRAVPEEAKARADAAAAAFDRERRTAGNSGTDAGGVPITLIFWGVVLLFFVLPAMFGRKRGRRWSNGSGGNWPILLWSVANEMGRGSRSGWGGGGGSWGGSSSGGGSTWGGGGFTGGGGGSFGGGGASGSW